jgi:hypothetical protein
MWVRNDPGERLRLRQAAVDFIGAYPSDGVAVVVRLYFVLSLMDTPADWGEAERRLGEVATPPFGSARDLYVIASAKLLRYRHQPEAAVELLRPIIGKVLDTRARAVLEEELTFDALEARAPYEAIAYMDAWLRSATEDERDGVRAKVAVALGAVPEAALRGALQAMRAGEQRDARGYGVDIQRLLAERLGQIAVDRGDAVLARWLLDPESASSLLADEVAGALGRLATSRRGIGNVVGQTIGLVLPTNSVELRDEASDVLRGVLWAIGAGRQDADKVGGVRLVTRDDGGVQSRFMASMEEVTGEGASVIIAALDADTARAAVDWAATSAMNVILLALPGRASAGRGAMGSTTFSVGEDWSDEVAVLEHGLEPGAKGGASEGARGPVALLADSEDVPGLLAAAGAGSLLQAPVSCDAASPIAGESPFPIAAWNKAGIDRWIVAGAPDCAAALFRGLRGRPRRGSVALSLEASETRGRPPPGLHVVSAAAGIVPPEAVDQADPRVADARAMVEQTGAPAGWWAALGHDAAVLARAALARLPADATSEAGAIAHRRAIVRQGLVDARAMLWSSEHEGFGETQTLARTIRLIEASR